MVYYPFCMDEKSSRSLYNVRCFFENRIPNQTFDDIELFKKWRIIYIY